MCTIVLCNVALVFLALQSRTVLGEEQQQVICNYFHGVHESVSGIKSSGGAPSSGPPSQTASVSFDLKMIMVLSIFTGSIK